MFGSMDEAWERAVETALEDQADPSSSPPRSLTLDGVVKCVHGRMPSPAILERFQTLEHLSLANIGLASLEKFPKLRSLQRLILSDNRISGGLEFLVEAGLDSLRDLDLSNNRIQYVEDLAPLAEMKLLSLDLYECPVTRIVDYRSKVFGLIRSLKYLDKMDAEENERPETDEEEDDEEEDDEDPGNGEVDGDERVTINGAGNSGGCDVVDADEIADLDEDEESDADEEEMDTNGSVSLQGERLGHGLSNGFRVAAVGEELVEDEDVEDEEYVEDEDEELVGEVDEEVGEGEDEDVVEVHEIEDSEEDGVEEDEEEDVDDEEEDDEDEDEDLEPSSTGRRTDTEGEIDGHDEGEDDENGEIGEENCDALEEERDYDVEDGEDEEDCESEYLVQPIRQPKVEAVGSELDAGNDEEHSEEEVDDDDEDPDGRPGSSSRPRPQLNKRRRDDSDDDGLDDDCVEDSRSSKRR